MIKVVSLKICPFVQRVVALLEAKNIPYEVEFVSLSDKPQWFSDISPTGQVPILITEGGTSLFESDAIVEYLDEISDPIEANVAPEQRALDRAWSYQATKHYLIQCSTQLSTDEEMLVERTTKLNKLFDHAEKALGDGPYFKGEQFSNVDVAWIPLLHRAAIIQHYSCHDFLADYPKLKAWQQELLKMDIVTRSVAADFEDVFVGFYLSDETYLGKKRNECRTEDTAQNSCQTATCC